MLRAYDDIFSTAEWYNDKSKVWMIACQTADYSPFCSYKVYIKLTLILPFIVFGFKQSQSPKNNEAWFNKVDLENKDKPKDLASYSILIYRFL